MKPETNDGQRLADLYHEAMGIPPDGVRAHQRMLLFKGVSLMAGGLLLAALCIAAMVSLPGCGGYYPCQEHAAPTADPGICMCECGWQPDADGGACIPKSESCGKLLEP